MSSIRSIAAAAITAAASAALAGPAAAAPAAPDLGAAARYLTQTTAGSGDPSLATAGSYSAGGFADFGLTIDGGLALAAARTDDATLSRVVAFLDHGADADGRTAADWMGVAPGDPPAGVESGAVGKSALLAEAAGADPHAFAGQDLIADLDRAVCAAPSTGSAPPSCAAAGNYDNATSTFDQTLAVIAQLRAGDAAGAASPVAFLQSLQGGSGAWPSLVTGHDADVDSTAMAVMALALVPGTPAADAVAAGQGWIASRQVSDGGFAGASGDSTNSTALALIALGLDPSAYRSQISDGLGFLAAHQNADGGFDIAADRDGSDLRASTQAVSGAVGTSFGTVTDPVAAPPPPPPSPITTMTTSPGLMAAQPTTTSTPATTPTPAPTAVRLSAVRRLRILRLSQGGRATVVGAAVAFRLNVAARVTVTLQRRRGRRWVRVARRTVSGRPGDGLVGVGAAHGRALAPGRYRVIVAARDKAGRRSAGSPLRFTVRSGRTPAHARLRAPGETHTNEWAEQESRRPR